MSNYKRQVHLDNKIIFIAKDGVNKVEFILKAGIPQTVYYGKEYHKMNKDIGPCQNTLKLLITISVDCFIELVQELSHRTACYKYAIVILKNVMQEENNHLHLSQEQIIKINEILEKAPY